MSPTNEKPVINAFTQLCPYWHSVFPWETCFSWQLMLLKYYKKQGFPVALSDKVFNLAWQSEKTTHFTPSNT